MNAFSSGTLSLITSFPVGVNRFFFCHAFQKCISTSLLTWSPDAFHRLRRIS